MYLCTPSHHLLTPNYSHHSIIKEYLPTLYHQAPVGGETKFLPTALTGTEVTSSPPSGTSTMIGISSASEEAGRTL
jgi:hypothetical protein